MDYMALEEGMMTAEAKARSNANAWERYANKLKCEVRDLSKLKDGRNLIIGGAIKLIKEMMQEINTMSPDNPLGDYEHIKITYEKYALEEADKNGIQLDYPTHIARRL